LQSNIIFSYPEYDEGNPPSYNFDRTVIKTPPRKIEFLWSCLNGTDNPSDIAGRPYYFPDPQGLSFFDRLENRTLTLPLLYGTSIIGSLILIHGDITII